MSSFDGLSELSEGCQNSLLHLSTYLIVDLFRVTVVGLATTDKSLSQFDKICRIEWIGGRFHLLGN
jgi:hypothetical protein